MSHSMALTIRKLTLAPLMAALMLIYLYCVRSDIFGSVQMLVMQLLFLSIFPLFAYPLQPLIPRYREQGREGQRHLAMLFAFIGYWFDCTFNFNLNVEKELSMVGWVYLLSGVLILFLNCLCKLHVSGHAAGISAAASLPIALGHPEVLLIGIPVMMLIFTASIKSKRHTMPQLIGGALIPVILTLILVNFL